MYVPFLTGLQGDCPNCKHARSPNKLQKEAAQQVSPCKPLPIDILSMNLYMSWAVSQLLEFQCNWKVQNQTQRPHKETIHNLSPQEKLLVYNNIAQCMRSCHWNCSVLVWSLGFFTEIVRSDREKTYCKPSRPNTMLPFHSGSLWRVSFFDSLYFAVCKNR